MQPYKITPTAIYRGTDIGCGFWASFFSTQSLQYFISEPIKEHDTEINFQMKNSIDLQKQL